MPNKGRSHKKFYEGVAITNDERGAEGNSLCLIAGSGFGYTLHARGVEQ